VAALSGAVALLAASNVASAALEPMTITATAPSSTVVGSPFEIQVAVEAEPGALDIAATPLRVRVKLAPECGGSFAGTPGPAALEATLPPPAPGQPYAQTISGQVTETEPGTDTICTFLEDAQERQFATDTQTEVSIFATLDSARQCTAAKQELLSTKRNLKPINRRIAKAKRALLKSHSPKRHKLLARKLQKLRKKKRHLAKQRRTVTRTIESTCP
jgi:hypothetical protein